MKNINEKKYITLIGTPLGQSFSPRMQNKAYEVMGENLEYYNTEADEKMLPSIINDVRNGSFIGCAVTKPNKVEVLKYLDGLDELCQKMGACNTVIKKADGKLIGYNTDGMGFYRSIIEEGNIDVEQSAFFILGAGGAGRAIASVLAYYGAKAIYVMDIHEDRAIKLAKDIDSSFNVDKYIQDEIINRTHVTESDEAEPDKVKQAKQEHRSGAFSSITAVSFGDYRRIEECTVIINATGVGMGHTAGENPLPKEWITSGKLYYDACYNPLKTQFLSDAENAGSNTLNGIGMLIYQGVAQIELWTGKTAPKEVMKKEVLDMIDELNSKQ